MKHHTIACLFLAVSTSLLAAQFQPGQSVGQADRAKPLVASAPAAFAQGRAEAETEWQTNTATLYRYGSDFEQPFFADIREVFGVLDLRNGEWLRVRIINRANGERKNE